jgi:uncharacterized membrane protein
MPVTSKIMTQHNQKIKAEVEQKLKNTGKKNIRVGIAMTIIAAIVGLAIFLMTPARWTLIAKLFLPGALFLGVGLRQFQIRDKKELREASVQMYGVEEPEKYWTCPKCKNENPNLTYGCESCDSCGYSLK